MSECKNCGNSLQVGKKSSKAIHETEISLNAFVLVRVGFVDRRVSNQPPVKLDHYTAFFLVFGGSLGVSSSVSVGWRRAFVAGRRDARPTTQASDPVVPWRLRIAPGSREPQLNYLASLVPEQCRE